MRSSEGNRTGSEVKDYPFTIGFRIREKLLEENLVERKGDRMLREYHAGSPVVLCRENKLGGRVYKALEVILIRCNGKELKKRKIE